MSRAQQVDVLWAGFKSSDGTPLAGGFVHSYIAGTTSPVSLYVSYDKSVQATNPIELDSEGRAQVWADGAYKFRVTDADELEVGVYDNLLYGLEDQLNSYCGQSSGTGGNYILSPSPAETSYSNGKVYSFVVHATNAGASTLNVSGIGAKSIKTGAGSALSGGELTIGNVVSVTYDLTNDYFIINTSNLFSTITVSGAADCGSVVAPILQSSGAIAIKPSGVEKWNFAAGGAFQPATDNGSDLGGAAARVATGHFVNVSTGALAAPSGNLALNGGSGAGLTLGVGTSNFLYLGADGTFYPGVDNSYSLGLNSYRFAAGYFVTSYSNTIQSYSGQGFYFGSGSSAQWRIGTDSTMYPVDTGHTMDIGSGTHRINDLFFAGKLDNGQSYTTGSYTALRTMTHPSAGFLNADYATAKSSIETEIQKLYRLIATLIDDTVK